ncbi:MAG: branched-chain amino acid ABC transporter permease [candidate division WOR-3 bacterium]
MKRIKNSLLWACWTGLVILPFTGLVKALIVAGIIFALSFFQFFPRVEITRKIKIRKLEISKQQKIIYGLILIFLILLPLFINRYLLDVATICGIYAFLTIGLNIVVGLTGLLVLGYVAFYAIGAYTYALLSVHYHIPFFLCLPICAVTAMVFGLLVGLPVLRLRGDYLAIVTLGFGEITRIVINNWDELTRGPNGIMHIARPQIFGFILREPIYYYYLIILFIIIAIFVFNRLDRSRIGRAWVAIREDDLAAAAMGINVTLYKLLAFGISASVAGVAGAFFASKMTHVSPESFTFLESVIILCMVIVGGMGSISGAILGAVILILLPEALRSFQNYRMLLFGIGMIILMRFLPQGILPVKRGATEVISNIEIEKAGNNL